MLVFLFFSLPLVGLFKGEVKMIIKQKGGTSCSWAKYIEFFFENDRADRGTWFSLM